MKKLNKIELQMAKEKSNLILEERGMNLYKVSKVRNVRGLKVNELCSKNFVLKIIEEINCLIITKKGVAFSNFEM